MADSPGNGQYYTIFTIHYCTGMSVLVLVRIGVYRIVLKVKNHISYCKVYHHQYTSIFVFVFLLCCLEK